MPPRRRGRAACPAGQFHAVVQAQLAPQVPDVLAGGAATDVQPPRHPAVWVTPSHQRQDLHLAGHQGWTNGGHAPHGGHPLGQLHQYNNSGLSVKESLYLKFDKDGIAAAASWRGQQNLRPPSAPPRVTACGVADAQGHGAGCARMGRP